MHLLRKRREVEPPVSYEQKIAELFAMSDEVWERHANPWSVWTRVAGWPVLLVAVWSHAWIGWWSLVAVVAVSVWLWLNPRLFAKPPTTKSWASRATLGERVWLNRASVSIPEEHEHLPHLLSGLAAGGFIFAIGGALANNLTATLFGFVITLFAKLWFCDRMVWLYADMKDKDSGYKAWLY